MKSTIINEMAEFKNAILEKMELMKNTPDEALTLAQTSLATSDANIAAITNLMSQCNDLKGECGFELYSRKQNLILHGITDTDHENCGRLQQRHNQVSRGIIVRFQSMTDKDAVWAAKTL